MNDVTRILQDIESGNTVAADQLLPLVYAELRQLAARKMSAESPGQTLQPTALVHEAWLRLVGGDDRKWHGRTHFFAAAAEAMRRILIDNARRKRALRHGGGQQHLDIADLDLPSPSHAKEDQLLAVHDALDQLAAQEPKMAELVKLRFFVGLTNKEAAEILAVSEPTVERWWTFARAWLFKAIQSP
jgi:RNA polymerase sigma factor (TIGR02999 family)